MALALPLQIYILSRAISRAVTPISNEPTSEVADFRIFKIVRQDIRQLMLLITVLISPDIFWLA